MLTYTCDTLTRYWLSA